MDVDVEAIISILGPWKRYQLFQLFFVGLTFMFGIANVVLLYVFIGYTPPHKCKTLDQSLHFYGIPAHINESSLTIDYGQCEINVYSNSTNVTSDKWTLTCVNGYTYEAEGETIVSEWDLVCSRAGLAALSQTIMSAGQCIGAVAFSSMADRFGRKPVLLFSSIALFLISAGSFFSPSYTIFAISRLLLGSLNQGAAITLITMMLELFPMKQKGTIGAFTNFTWTLSVLVIAAFAYPLRTYSWRYTQLAAAFLSLHCFLGFFFVDESFRWLVANNRTEEAIKVLKKIARVNKMNVNTILAIFHQQKFEKQQITRHTPRKNSALDTEEETELFEAQGRKENQENQDFIEKETSLKTAKSTTKQYSLLDIIKHKLLLRNSLILWFAWAVNSMTYYGLFLTSSSLAGNRFVNYVINSAVEFPSNVLFLIMINRTSRKTLTVFFHLVAALSLIISVSLLTIKDDGGKAAIVSTVFSFLGKFAISSSFNAVWLFTPELYPTNMRSAGMGTSSMMARIGGMLAPFSALLASKVIWGPGVVFGACCIIATILITILPETGNKELPTSLAELIRWNKEMSGWNFMKFRKKENRNAVQE